MSGARAHLDLEEGLESGNLTLDWREKLNLHAGTALGIFAPQLLVAGVTYCLGQRISEDFACTLMFLSLPASYFTFRTGLNLGMEGAYELAFERGAFAFREREEKEEFDRRALASKQSKVSKEDPYNPRQTPTQ